MGRRSVRLESSLGSSSSTDQRISALELLAVHCVVPSSTSRHGFPFRTLLEANNGKGNQSNVEASRGYDAGYGLRGLTPFQNVTQPYPQTNENKGSGKWHYLLNKEKKEMGSSP